MDIQRYMMPEGERPLDRIAEGGGFAAIFRSFAVIGDSLSSGEFETLDGRGAKGYHDLFEHSWGQYMARAMGSLCHNFSRGGMTAKEYMESFAAANSMFDPRKASQMYILAMGCNDISMAIREGTDLGDMTDIAQDWRNNKPTFAGYFAQIVSKYKELSPDAKFFFLTMPRSGDDESAGRMPLCERHRELMHEMASHFANAYVIDLRQYAPEYDAEFERRFYLNGHLNPAGYLLTAKMVMSYIDWIIRANPEDFSEAGLILSGFINHKEAIL